MQMRMIWSIWLTQYQFRIIIGCNLSSFDQRSKCLKTNIRYTTSTQAESIKVKLASLSHINQSMRHHSSSPASTFTHNTNSISNISSRCSSNNSQMTWARCSIPLNNLSILVSKADLSIKMNCHNNKHTWVIWKDTRCSKGSLMITDRGQQRMQTKFHYLRVLRWCVRVWISLVLLSSQLLKLRRKA